MFLRFIGREIDLRSGRHKGIFTLAYELRDSNELLNHDGFFLNTLLSYFDKNLPKPTKFSRNKNDYHKNTISTAWFKDSAAELIQKVWELKSFLEQKDIIVEVLKSEKPGYTIYEDDFQIIVIPF